MREKDTAPAKRRVQFTKKKGKSQKQIIFLELFKKPLNSKLLHLCTGIPREDICRRKTELEDEGLIKVIYKDYCPVTGRLVQYLSANPMQWAKWEDFNKKQKQ